MIDHKIEQLEAVDSMTIRCPFEHGNPDKTGLLFATLPAWRHQDDARRAAASWNACLDFDIETLELAAKVGGLKIALDSHNAARSMCEDFRRQLAEAQADNAAMHSAAHRLAIEAECFYLDCKDMPVLSKWTDPMLDAIGAVQALRWKGDTSALSAAIEAAVEPYRKDAERYLWCKSFPDSAASVFDNLGPDYFDREIDMLKAQSDIDAALSAKEAP